MALEYNIRGKNNIAMDTLTAYVEIVVLPGFGGPGFLC
jgi:hypothetical protein